MNPVLACAAGIAVLNEVLAPGFLAGVQQRGARLGERLAEVFGAQARAVRGAGMLWGVALDEAPLPLMRACLERGLVVGVAGDNVLRLAPPLTITDDEVDMLIERLRAARADV